MSRTSSQRLHLAPLLFMLALSDDPQLLAELVDALTETRSREAAPAEVDG